MSVHEEVNNVESHSVSHPETETQIQGLELDESEIFFSLFSDDAIDKPNGVVDPVAPTPDVATPPPYKQGKRRKYSDDAPAASHELLVASPTDEEMLAIAEKFGGYYWPGESSWISTPSFLDEGNKVISYAAMRLEPSGKRYFEWDIFVSKIYRLPPLLHLVEYKVEDNVGLVRSIFEPMTLIEPSSHTFEEVLAQLENQPFRDSLVSGGKKDMETRIIKAFKGKPSKILTPQGQRAKLKKEAEAEMA